MTSEHEGTFTTRDGTSLYTKTWKSSSPSNLHLVFIHGFSDHINAYYDLFPTLSKQPYNISIYGFDQRGWGRSVPPNKKSSRGLTGDTHLVLSDIHDFILHTSQEIQSSTPSSDSAPKLFLMGHSMGGAEVLHYLLSSGPSAAFKSSAPLSQSQRTTNPFPISGLILESPHIAFPRATQPSSLLVISGRLAAKVLPNHQMVQKLGSSAMSRDPTVCKDWDDDDLCHDTGTLRGLASLLNRAEALDGIGLGRKSIGLEGKLMYPVFWAHGSDDMVCDFGSSKRLYGKLVEDGQEGGRRSGFKTYEGGYHKIHAEPDGMGAEFAKDVGEWILRIAGVNQSQEGVSRGGTAVSSDPVLDAGAPTSTNASIPTTEDPENVKSRL